MAASGGAGGEYPDEAGYPDGEGTLDEGTGAFRGSAEAEDGARSGSGEAPGEETGDTGGPGGVEVEAEVPQGIDQLDEFDAPDARDE